MIYIRPKKSLGQHFLHDENIARKVADSLTAFGGYTDILEIGPGTGALTKWLLQKKEYSYTGVEVDTHAVDFLQKRFETENPNIISQDFLSLDPTKYFGDKSFAVIGNFPYNISSQILFKVLSWRNQIPEMVGMFQKEVAERIVSQPGNKVYGILSVLTQAFYHAAILFQVSEHVFNPPPQVKSAVIRLQRKESSAWESDEKLFFSVVKSAFNQRRKTLHNSLKGIPINWNKLPAEWPGKRAEQLSVESFIRIASVAGNQNFQPS